MGIVHDAFRRAYNWVTAVSMVVVVFMALSVRFSFFTLTHRGHYSFGIIALLFLNYLIQTLPAAIIVWTEPVIEKTPSTGTGESEAR